MSKKKLKTTLKTTYEVSDELIQLFRRYNPDVEDPDAYVTDEEIKDMIIANARQSEEALQMAEGFKRDNTLCMIPTEEIARMIRICRSGGQFTLTDEEIQRFRNNGRFAVGAFAGLSDEQVREKITRNMEKFFRIIVEKNPQMFKPEEAREA